MGSVISAQAARERLGTALDAVDAAHEVLRATSSDMVGNDFRVDVAERLEIQPSRCRPRHTPAAAHDYRCAT